MPLPPAFPPDEVASANHAPEASTPEEHLYDPDDGAEGGRPIGQGGETNLDIDGHAPDPNESDEWAVEPGAPDAPVDAVADDTEDAGDSAAADEGEVIEYPQYLLDASGMTAEEAHEAFGSPEALEEQVAASDLRAIQYGLPAAPQGAQDLPPTQELPPAQPLGQAQQTASDEFELPPPAEGEDWDENTKVLMQHMAKQHREALAARDREIAAMKQHFETIQQERVQRDVSNYINEFDSFVNNLDESWAPVFGRGTGAEIYQQQPNSLAMKNREQLDAVASQLQNVRIQAGQPPLPTEHALRRAMKIAFEAEMEREVEQKVTQRVVTQQRRHTSRPTMRRSSPLTNVEKAARTADEFYARFGLPAEDDGGAYDNI